MSSPHGCVCEGRQETQEERREKTMQTKETRNKAFSLNSLEYKGKELLKIIREVKEGGIWALLETEEASRISDKQGGNFVILTKVIGGNM